MAKIAFLFAGQGAQAPGMGKELYEAGGRAAGAFALAEKLRPGTMQQCFAGTAEELALTVNTQPCVYTVAMAAALALADRGVAPQGVAGFSLGEMAALGFAAAFPAEDGFRLVCLRAQLMQQANEKTPGAMAAVLKLPDERVEALCQCFAHMYPVNYNCDGQLVVAGSQDEMPAFCAAVKEAGGLARPLAVGGGFHSPFMAAAAAEFGGLLGQAHMSAPALPVYANATALPYGDEREKTLAAQMCSPVLWKQSVRRMATDGFDTFVEVGPGKALGGFVKRIVPEATILNVQDAASLAATVAALA